MPSRASSERHAQRFDLESLARSLAAANPAFVVWKGGRALDSAGDIDAAAPRSAWPALERAFADWSRSQGLAGALACEHAIGALILVGYGGAAGTRLLQVDLVAERLVHGAPVWTASDALGEAAVLGGVARTLPGAEGILRRLADRGDVTAVELVLADHEAARRLLPRLGLRARLAARPARIADLALGAELFARMLRHPRSLARAVRSDGARRRCPVLRALANGRRIDGSMERWVEAASASHRVHELETGL